MTLSLPGLRLEQPQWTTTFCAACAVYLVSPGHPAAVAGFLQPAPPLERAPDAAVLPEHDEHLVLLDGPLHGGPGALHQLGAGTRHQRPQRHAGHEAADLVQSTVQYSTVQYSTVQYSTIQYGTVQHSTIQNRSVQISTVQYSTVQ